ncbi:MAG: cytochrome c3 family protein [Proteobacteria bacterium]|nr:cytochrome c3 family protein [Pseudomonadota bacterium]
MEKRASKQFGGALPFLLGFLGAAAIGWVLVPELVFCAKEQPFRFSHQTHVEGQEMACEDCHFFREDGSYAGFPRNEECMNCHDVGAPEDRAVVLEAIEAAGGAEAVLAQESGPEDLDSLIVSAEPEDIAAEREMLVGYLLTGVEIPWYTYQYQPDNVFFSHKAHANLTLADPDAGHGEAEGAEAVEAEETTDQANCALCPPAGIESGTSPPPFMENVISGYSKSTMKMWQCEQCHAKMHQDNACYVCHK